MPVGPVRALHCGPPTMLTFRRGTLQGDSRNYVRECMLIRQQMEFSIAVNKSSSIAGSL
jgi:hypothetical protein